MGNTHVFFHRLPAISTSCLTSLGLAFAIGSGMTCSFLNVIPSNGVFLEFVSDNGMIIDVPSSSLGILCENKHYEIEGDIMREWSRIFLFVSWGIGGLAVTLSVALTTVLPPTECTWKLLSILAAVVAVVQVPIFLVFEAEPCTEENCTISNGVFFLIMSTISWIAVTIVTQCMDPPLWAVELNGWRVRSDGPSSITPKKKATGILGWLERRKWATLALATTESGSNEEDDVEAKDIMEDGSYYANSTNSRLLLKVEHGRRPGDDQKSVTTFGDLDDDVRMAEADRLDPLLGKMIYPEDELEPDLLGDAENLTNINESFVICGIEAESSQYYSHPKAFQNGDDDLFENEEMRVDHELFLASDENCRSKIKVVSGIRGLSERVKRGTSGRFQGGKNYSSMLDNHEDGICSSSQPFERIPMERIQSIPPTEILMTSPENSNDNHEHELLHDWNVLHAATNSRMILLSVGDLSRCGEVPDPIFYASESSGYSLSSKDHQHNHDDSSTISSSSGGDFMDHQGPDQKNLIIAEVRRRHRQRRLKNRGHFSGAHSVCSQTSLLDLTIAEETDFQLQEFDGSTDEIPRKLTLYETYPVARTKSAPGAFGNLVRSAFHPTAMMSELNVAQDEFNVVALSTSKMRHEPSTKPRHEDEHTRGRQLEYFSPIDESVRGRSNEPKRSRSMNLPGKKKSAVHPLATPEKRFYSSPLLEMSTYRRERMFESGIHAPDIALVSDESSASSEDYSVGDRSSRSNVSQRARRARIERLQRDNKRRSRTLDPPTSRKSTGIFNIVDFDPSLNIVWKSRIAGIEYGPDEASL